MVVRLISIFALVLPLVSTSFGGESRSCRAVDWPAASGTTVKIPKDSMGRGPQAYGTNPLVVAPGTAVTWVNEDSVAHTVTADDGSFDSKYINPGSSWSHAFDKPGKYPYYCTLHGKETMSGAVEVK